MRYLIFLLAFCAGCAGAPASQELPDTAPKPVEGDTSPAALRADAAFWRACSGTKEHNISTVWCERQITVVLIESEVLSKSQRALVLITEEAVRGFKVEPGYEIRSVREGSLEQAPSAEVRELDAVYEGESTPVLVASQNVRSRNRIVACTVPQSVGIQFCHELVPQVLAYGVPQYVKLEVEHTPLSFMGTPITPPEGCTWRTTEAISCGPNILAWALDNEEGTGAHRAYVEAWLDRAQSTETLSEPEIAVGPCEIDGVASTCEHRKYFTSDGSTLNIQSAFLNLRGQDVAVVCQWATSISSEQDAKKLPAVCMPVLSE